MKSVITFVILIFFWFALSGQFDAVGVVSGIFYCALVAVISSNLIFRRKENLRHAFTKIHKFIVYAILYLKDIALANIDVAYRVLHPRMPINPKIIEYQSTLQSDFALTALANSITITPGTVTVDIINGRLIVHTIDESLADGLMSGQLEKRVASFGETE